MRLGLLADIHEANDLLNRAIVRLQKESVDQFVLLGDIAETGRDLAATVDLLSAVGVIGVWGNHDLGLCSEPDEYICRRYGGKILEFFSALEGRLEHAGCLFSHAQSWMDPADWSQPWYQYDLPMDSATLERNFFASNCHMLFQGHYHRWYAETPGREMTWDGQAPLRLEPGQRCLVVVHAVCQGWCAIWDTKTLTLQPIYLE